MKISKKTFSAVLSALILTAGASAFDITFTKVTGKVEFLDGNEWVQAEEGDVVDEGTVVSTGYKSGAVLQAKSAIMEIGPMTRITLEQLTEVNGKENTSLFIDSGTIQTQVESGNKFKVRSAVATASVRGTGFIQTADGELIVTENTVDYGLSEASEAQVGNAGSDMNTQASDEKSTPFTNAREIGNINGVSVSEGQRSTVDTFTVLISSPGAEMDRETRNTHTQTYTQSEIEGVASITSGTGSDSAGIQAAPTPVAGRATLTVNIQLPDGI